MKKNYSQILHKTRMYEFIQFPTGYAQSVNALITPQGIIAVISQSVEKCMHQKNCKALSFKIKYLNNVVR